ncbi:MAG: hypothetical protein AUK47_16820 [Deltaproteobacteria bacterium CG2_30_63_29]|nr:MAG: hypothetical protein AUK47_16820 [Deltaproteobacteria bacterium CG2_30_63_29]
MKAFKGFFTWLGKTRSEALRVVCSDMWKPYLNVIHRHAGQALNVLDKFHIVAHLNKAVDETRRQDAAELRRQGDDVTLKHTRWCLLKRPGKLTKKQTGRLCGLLRLNLRTARAYSGPKSLKFADETEIHASPSTTRHEVVTFAREWRTRTDTWRHSSKRKRRVKKRTWELKMSIDTRIRELAEQYRPLAIELLKEAIRIPADHVSRPKAEGGDPKCGLSNGEGPRVEYLRRRVVEIGAVDRDEDAFFDGFGNLVWELQNPDDGVAAADKTVVYMDGHTDTVQALRESWLAKIGGGIDAYDGLIEPSKVDAEFLESQLGYIPPRDEWEYLVFGRGSADQLGGVVCQIVATKILRELRGEGLLDGILIRSYGTVCEEDNDGAGPMYLMRHELPGKGSAKIPDVVILSEGTGDSRTSAVGIYRGQRGRMQIEVVVTGRSCHGSMPWEGLNPLEFGAAIVREAADAYDRRDGFLDDAFLGHGTRTASFARLDTPSDCAVPDRFTFRFDRRLTIGETPAQAVADVESLAAVAAARAAGLKVEVAVPTYDLASWKGFKLNNPQIYMGWVTPAEHPAITSAVSAYQSVCSPYIAAGTPKGKPRKEPRVDRWIFSTDGVGFPLPKDDNPIDVPASKHWVAAGAFTHPPMFGIGPGLEQNTHKIGECVDSREMVHVIAFMARFPSLFRAATR